MRNTEDTSLECVPGQTLLYISKRLAEVTCYTYVHYTLTLHFFKYQESAERYLLSCPVGIYYIGMNGFSIKILP